MAAISDKIQDALNEGRTLILGAQIIVGLSYNAAFEPGSGRLSKSSQYVSLLGLSLVLISFALLMSPVSYHCIVDRGGDHQDLENFILVIMVLALFPFALSLGLTLYVAADKVFGFRTGVAIGTSISMAAYLFWYGLGRIRGPGTKNRADAGHKTARKNSSVSRTSKEGAKMEHAEKQGEVKDKINHVLTEARMVLPGAQALIGFQFVVLLMNDFDKLSRNLQKIHLAGLILTMITTILLMTPAAYHRLVEKGGYSESFHCFASWIVLAAMIPLAAGISADYYVVASKVTGSAPFALCSALLLVTLFYGLWFGFTLYRKKG